MQTEGSSPSTQSAASPIDSFDSDYPQGRRIPANITQFTFDLIDSHEELRVVKFNGTEAISTPFEYSVTLASKNDLLKADQFMSKSALLTFMSHDQNELLHGEIAQFDQYDEQGDYLLYHVLLVPRFWFLQKRHNHRIFQNLSVVQIIEQIFLEAGISTDHYKLQLSQEYLPRSYCTQYDESEFDFLTRLMVEEGLHYHFEHHLDRHIMVIADHTAAFADIQGETQLPYHPRDGLNQKVENIFEFRFLFQTRYGKASSRDYCFKKPLNTLQHQQQHSFDPHLEDYTYPGNYQDQSAAQKSTQLQLQQHQHKREQSFAKSNCQRLRAGRRYQLFDNPNRQLNQQYLLTQVIHQGEQPQSLDEYGAGASSQYHNECQCIPARTPYKTPLTQPKPLIAGYQSAAVTGPKGEEIYTNEHAQSKVQYPWDREGQRDENSSCWLRSTQGWAGKSWGCLILPRMGQEAKVAYIHGDPDRPVITGRLYNERHQLPYALPSHKTRSSYKSNSTLGGKGYNEIRMEDKKNHEQVFFHAQKDIDIRAKNDRRDTVQHDRHLIVDNNRYEHIKSNSYHTSNANQNEKIGQQHSISIGQSQHLKAGQAILTDVGQNIFFKAGQKIVLEAGVELTIKAGGGFIKIDPLGITAQGATINFNSGTGAGPALKASPQSPSMAIEADKDKPGQTFRPIPPQVKQEAEKIGFKGEISRLLQAGNDDKQALCIPCILAEQAKQEVLTKVLPKTKTISPRSALAPLPLEPLDKEIKR